MRAPAAVLLLLVAAGCATKAHMRIDGAFVPLRDGEFVYATKGGFMQPEESPRYEAMRLSLLDEEVKRRGYCREGYEIVAREIDASHAIRYRGRCKS